MEKILDTEHVVLVDSHNVVLGIQEKKLVHQNTTPLHRAFSCFLFRADGKVLVQQRAKSKKTWPLIWSNSFCGHPNLFESEIESTKRRGIFELGITQLTALKFADFRYCITKDGVMENEICPIMLAFSDQTPEPNPEEVENIKWLTILEMKEQVLKDPKNWSSWCVQELEILEKHDISFVQKALQQEYYKKFV